MPANEVVVHLPDVNVGVAYADVFATTIAPTAERLSNGQTLEIRRCEDPARCFVQCGPMRYEVSADQLVELVNKAFPYAASQVRNARMGKYEIAATPEALGEALRRGFHSLTKLSGMMPKRIVAPLDLIAAASGVDPAVLAETTEVFGCVLVVDALADSITIDYGPTGFPFTVTIRVADEPA